MIRKRPKRPCAHFKEYGWSRLYCRYAWRCALDGDICMEDWRKAAIECPHYKPSPTATSYTKACSR